ncbi:MAG: BlaI/MecI/CopY family transcriptional regulator [Clostridia bacterium]|nr:BlaI/MecI/CopY family transcriptional regulator [Clostridia bacterium]
MEQKLMSLVWANSPVTVAQLARIAAPQIGWKRTTTYTVVARLCERGFLERQGSLVRPLLSREAAEEEAVRGLLESLFEGDCARMRATVERILPSETKDLAPAVDNSDEIC